MLTRLKIFSSLICLLNVATASAQGLWADHLNYASPTYAAAVGSVAVASNDMGIMLYDNGELTRLTKVNHLSDCGISALAANSSQLFVAYSNGNIDIVDIENRATTNIPEYKTSSLVSAKSINRLALSGSRLFCASQSGLLDVDINRAEIKGFYRLGGESVSDVCVFSDTIFVSTTKGLFAAPVNNKILEDATQWTNVFPQKTVSALTTFDSHLVCLVKQSDALYTLHADRDTIPFDTLRAPASRLLALDDFLVVAADTTLLFYNSSLQLSQRLSSYDFGGQTASMHIADIAALADGRLSIADLTHGLVISSVRGSASRYLINGPGTNVPYDIECSNRTLYASYGGASGSAFSFLYRPVTIFTLTDDTWTSSSSTSYLSGTDALLFAVDPNAPDSVYLSTYRGGIFKVENQKLSTQYSEHNSPLSSIYGTRVSALAYDNYHNLIVSNLLMPTGLHLKTPDNQWYTLSYAPANNNFFIKSLAFSPSDNGWMIFPRTNPGLFVFNINGTPETDSDDLYMSALASDSDPRSCGQLLLIDTDGEVVSSSPQCLAIDRSGAIWVGTDNGICVLSSDKNIFTDGAVFKRIKVPRNDDSGLADYLLDNTTINCIAVDGANRKWIGTQDRGLYVVSADGLTTDYTFTAENSPLFSNNITDIAIDHHIGRVYIATSVGILSFRAEATAPASKMSDVKIYPNPVSHSLHDFVNIAGLESSSLVTITDVSGGLVATLESFGGQARWNLHRLDGSLATRGVYIVWCASSDGSNKAVGKIMIK